MGRLWDRHKRWLITKAGNEEWMDDELFAGDFFLPPFYIGVVVMVVVLVREFA